MVNDRGLPAGKSLKTRIFELADKGLSNQEIAKQLNTSPGYVAKVKSNAKKTGVNRLKIHHTGVFQPRASRKTTDIIDTGLSPEDRKRLWELFKKDTKDTFIIEKTGFNPAAVDIERRYFFKFNDTFRADLSEKLMDMIQEAMDGNAKREHREEYTSIADDYRESGSFDNTSVIKIVEFLSELLAEKSLVQKNKGTEEKQH